MTGYSVVEAIERAITIASKKAGVLTLDGNRLAKALETFRGVKLLVGPTTFTSKLHLNFTRPMAIIRVVSGKGRFQEYWSPARVPPSPLS